MTITTRWINSVAWGRCPRIKIRSRLVGAMALLAAAVAVSPSAFAVDFPAAVDGVITLTTAGTYSAAVPTSTKLVVNAKGSVTLSSTTKYTGTVEVESGSTLVVPNTTILANAPINVKSGGTLNPTFASPGQWVKAFLQPITIAGTGNGGIGAFTYGGSGNADSIVKTLILSADATIDCSKRWGISNGNGAGTLDLAGHTLTRIGGNNLMLVSLTVTPGKFVNTVGKITFQSNGGKYGVKADCKGEDTVFEMNGGSIEFWACGTEVPYKFNLNAAGVSAGSGGGKPPYNCFSGPVNVNFWLNVEPAAGKSLGFMGPLAIAKEKALCLNSAGTLYVGGPVSGESHQLKVANSGLLIVQKAGDAGAPRFVMQNGSYELDVDTVKSEMMRVANGGSSWGVFRHKRGNMSFSTWDNPRVGESANSFGVYVFESGEMHPQNSFYLANENAGSHGLFLQKGGHFVLEGNPNDSSLSRTFAAGACNAEIAFVQTGGTNDTLYARTSGDAKTRFSFGTKGGTNMTFAITGKDTLFRTDGFWWGSEATKLQAVIAINDGATFQARRFSCSTKRATGTDVTLSVDGGVICPSFGWGWGNDDWNASTFLTRAPEHVIVGPKGIVFDTSKIPQGGCYMPLTLKAPEGNGIASISIPTEAASAAYHGPVPVAIVGPAGSFGASAYADYDFDTKKLSKIVVTSAGCNYDKTTKIYLRSPDAKSSYLCTDFTLTGTQTSGALVKRGSLTLYLYGKNTYQGGTVVEEGELNQANQGFPANTALTVRKGATFNGGSNSSITVSRLEGEGSVKTPGGLTVTEALVLDADRVFAEGATALMSSGKVTFFDGATVEVSLTDAQKTAYRPRKPVAVLSAANGISGTPKLKVNGAEDGEWLLVNTGTTLKFGPRRGMTILVK